MKTTKAIDILLDHNAWRKSQGMEPPKHTASRIGEAITTLCRDADLLIEALAELVAATRDKWRTENGSLRQYKAVTAAEKLLKK
jgi:hypothetical protein